jgi:hypothetical protein
LKGEGNCEITHPFLKERGIAKLLIPFERRGELRNYSSIERDLIYPLFHRKSNLLNYEIASSTPLLSKERVG